MAPKSQVYIAGVGCSPTPPNNSSSNASPVSAGTKALLDAGLTFDDITHCVVKVKDQTSSVEVQALKTFGDEDVTVEEVDEGLELDKSCRLIREQSASCTFVIMIEKSVTVAFVLVSDDLLWRYPYLKDSSVVIQETDTPMSDSGVSLKKEPHHVCQMVWTLRGWSQNPAGKDNRFCFKGRQGQYFEIRRADANDIPKWEAVEHKQDGKHRLGYNPATQNKEVSQEDLDAVRASQKTAGVTKHDVQFRRKGGDRAALARL